MTIDEVHRKYTAEPLTNLGDGCVIININKTYKQAKGTKSIYEVTKQSWVINKARIPGLKYVLSEYGRFIVEVFEVDEDGWYQVKDHNGKTRWGFNGKQAPAHIRNLYLNRSIVKKRGAANPISYNLSSLWIWDFPYPTPTSSTPLATWRGSLKGRVCQCGFLFQWSQLWVMDWRSLRWMDHIDTVSRLIRPILYLLKP